MSQFVLYRIFHRVDYGSHGDDPSLFRRFAIFISVFTHKDTKQKILDVILFGAVLSICFNWVCPIRMVGVNAFLGITVLVSQIPDLHALMERRRGLCIYL